MAYIYLTTAAKVAGQLGITDPAQIALIDEYIRQVSAAAIAHLGREIDYKTRTESYRIYQNQFRLYLDVYPLESVASIKRDGVLMDAARYRIDDAKNGILYNRETWLSTQRGLMFLEPYVAPKSAETLIEIEYTAGWRLPPDPLADLPADIEGAIIADVKSAYYANARDYNVVSEKVDDLYQVTYSKGGYTSSGSGGGGGNMLLTASTSVLNLYKRYEL